MAGNYRRHLNGQRKHVRAERNFRALQFEPLAPDASASFFVRRCDETHLPFFWHYHPEIEIDVYLEGEGIRFVGDSIQNFQEGDLCLLGSNLPHSWTTVPTLGKRTRSIFIQFAPDCFGAGFFSTPEMQSILSLLSRAQRGLRFYGRTQKTVRERLIAMTKNPKGSWQQTCNLLGVLGVLAESKECVPLATGSLGPVPNSTVNRRLVRVLDYMNADPDSIPPQQMAARRARLSPPAFSRFFKRCIGKTYVQYRNELRIGRVCRQLLDTEKGITEIAMNAGFNNLSNFNEQFLSIKGVTPRAYRQKAKQSLTATLP